jgi:DUF971 family protein
MPSEFDIMESRQQATLSPNASPVAANVSKAERIFEIRWDDGHVSRFKTPDLRSMCECANCIEDRKKREEKTAPRTLHVLGSANRSEIASVTHVGRYAFGVGWMDGHQSIYTYGYLATSCPCQSCVEARNSAI